MRCAIWYHLHNLKNVKNTRGGVLLLVKLQAKACNFTVKVTLLHGCFLQFLNCANDTKYASHIFFQKQDRTDFNILKKFVVKYYTQRKKYIKLNNLLTQNLPTYNYFILSARSKQNNFPLFLHQHEICNLAISNNEVN